MCGRRCGPGKEDGDETHEEEDRVWLSDPRRRSAGASSVPTAAAASWRSPAIPPTGAWPTAARRAAASGRPPTVGRAGATSPTAISGAAPSGRWPWRRATPAVLYAGMGECGFRANVTHGDGVYKSADGGAAWLHWASPRRTTSAASSSTRAIRRPVYVAALGHRFGPNPERGVYRSQRRRPDVGTGAAPGERAGRGRPGNGPARPAHPLCRDLGGRAPPLGLLERRRGQRASTARADGGDDLERSLATPGLPHGPIGRIGICVSPADPRPPLRAGRGARTAAASIAPATAARPGPGPTTSPTSWCAPGTPMHIVADPRDADARVAAQPQAVEIP